MKKQNKLLKKLLIYTIISFKTVFALQMLNRVFKHMLGAQLTVNSDCKKFILIRLKHVLGPS